MKLAQFQSLIALVVIAPHMHEIVAVVVFAIYSIAALFNIFRKTK